MRSVTSVVEVLSQGLGHQINKPERASLPPQETEAPPACERVQATTVASEAGRDAKIDSEALGDLQRIVVVGDGYMQVESFLNL